MTEQVQTACDTDRIEADVTAVIEACGGDPRNAIKALLVEQEILEQRIARLEGRCRSATSADERVPTVLIPHIHDASGVVRDRPKHLRNLEP